MKAIAVSFDNPSPSLDYHMLMRVFKRSWETHNPDIPLDVHIIDSPEHVSRKYGFDANTAKLEVWGACFKQDTIFLDCDMLCMGKMADGFDLIKDVGYTKREGVDCILNGGVSYFKYTPAGREFMEEYVRVNRRMYTDADFWEYWRVRYDGLNQAAFGYVMENSVPADPMPEIYNLCPPWNDWQSARMIHIKSKLRRQCLEANNRDPDTSGIVGIWQSVKRSII